MPKLNNEGDYAGKIIAAEIIEGRFGGENRKYIELKFTVETPDGEACVYLELSGDYVTSGNNKGRKRAVVSLETLKTLGYRHGADISKLDEMINHDVQITAKTNEKGYLNYFFKIFIERELDNRAAASLLSGMLAAEDLAELKNGAPPSKPQHAPSQNRNMFAKSKAAAASKPDDFAADEDIPY